jgi:hypothetical protein
LGGGGRQTGGGQGMPHSVRPGGGVQDGQAGDKQVKVRPVGGTH